MPEKEKLHDGYQTLDWKIIDGIGHLMLNQPPGNTMTTMFFQELHHVVLSLKNVEELKGIIIYGSGRHFSSGADLDELTGKVNKEFSFNNMVGFAGRPSTIWENLSSLSFLSDLNIPVIAAITGVCIGSAFELALSCHFRLCTGNTVMGLPESTYGLMPGLGGIRRLTELVSKPKAMELVFKGATFSAKEAHRIGIVDALIPKDKLIQAAISLVHIASPNYRKYNRKEYIQQFKNEMNINQLAD